MGAQTICIALVVSFVVILSQTYNCILALTTTFVIGAVISSIVATYFLCGYTIELVSAVLLVMIIGMSIDYAVHIAHAYNEGVGSRAQKTLQVIQGVGVSVLSGAPTTFLASLPIFGTLIYVYFKMAIFLVLVALFGVF